MNAAKQQKLDLLGQMDAGWHDLQVFLGTLAEPQWTQVTDDAGWTVKDHVMHLALWEDSVYALIMGQPRAEAIGLTLEQWHLDTDARNELLRQQHTDLSIEQVRERFSDIHYRLLYKLEEMSYADYERPYSHYQPNDAQNDEPLLNWITGDTFEHYAEHIPWMQAIAARYTPPSALLM